MLLARHVALGLVGGVASRSPTCEPELQSLVQVRARRGHVRTGHGRPPRSASFREPNIQRALAGRQGAARSAARGSLGTWSSRRRPRLRFGHKMRCFRCVKGVRGSRLSRSRAAPSTDSLPAQDSAPEAPRLSDPRGQLAGVAAAPRRLADRPRTDTAHK